jgi:hypothetical protein
MHMIDSTLCDTNDTESLRCVSSCEGLGTSNDALVCRTPHMKSFLRQFYSSHQMNYFLPFPWLLILLSKFVQISIYSSLLDYPMTTLPTKKITQFSLNIKRNTWDTNVLIF